MKATNLQYFPRSIPEALLRFEHSDKTAIFCGNDKISYKELLTDAKKVARVLIKQNVKKGNRVVLNMSRTIDYIRMYLGIIFAGGIDVTIHSGWPEQQRKHVISDCSPVLIVNDKRAKELLSAELSKEELNQSLPEIKGEDPFQIVYTSGSTGIPKGVVNCHQLLINNNLLKDESEKNQLLRYFVNNCHCVLLDANLAFIAATINIFMALMNEKELCLATDEELKTPKGLADCIRKSNVDEMGGILSRYYKYLEEPEFSDAMKGIRHIYLTGEAPVPKIMDTFCEYSNLAVFHGYGSSETGGIFSKIYRKGDDIVYNPASSLYPIYLLDEDNNEVVSTGSVGEICVGGYPGKYGYYWNNPELTSKKYIEHPIYGRLFHIGDMARLEPDGNLKIVGRLDGMAKLHGQRIELGAIEKVMEDFPGIRRAAVKIQGEGSNAVLCGYYSGTVDESAFRRSLAESLPYYMVPSFLIDGIGWSRIIYEIAGEVTPISDVRQYNRYMHYIMSDFYREESRKIWGKAIADHPHLTEFHTTHGTNRGRKMREYLLGKLLAEKANQFCRNTHITASALVCLALGRVLMDLYRTEEVGFISIISGRNAENSELTGMFSVGIPLYVKKGDTPATVQEQIVSALSRPLPNMDDLGLSLDDSSSKYHVILSMQNYQQNFQNTRNFDRYLFMNNALSRGILPKRSPAPIKKLTILVFPEYLFNITFIYDGQNIDDNFVQKLGGSLLTQLRCLIEL